MFDMRLCPNARLPQNATRLQRPGLAGQDVRKGNGAVMRAQSWRAGPASTCGGLESHGSGRGGLGTCRGALSSIPEQFVHALAELQVTRSLPCGGRLSLTEGLGMPRVPQWLRLQVTRACFQGVRSACEISSDSPGLTPAQAHSVSATRKSTSPGTCTALELLGLHIQHGYPSKVHPPPKI